MAAMNTPVVEFWDDPYIPKYMGDSYSDIFYSQVDSKTLYDGIDALQIKVAGDITGVDNTDWFNDLEEPDIRQPFDVMVKQKLQHVNIYVTYVYM